MSDYEINDGGPAFPQVNETSGMSLRDWFAGQTSLTDAHNILLDIEYCEKLVGHPRPDLDTDVEGGLRWTCAVSAKLKYMQADAMLEARK